MEFERLRPNGKSTSCEPSFFNVLRSNACATNHRRDQSISKNDGDRINFKSDLLPLGANAPNQTNPAENG